MNRKLLILHDSAEFGGHERMLLALLPAVLGADSPFAEVVFCFPSANRRLLGALEGLSPRLRLIQWPFVKRRAEPYLHRFRWRYRAAVRKIVATERPDTVLLVHGRIENLAVPMATMPRSTLLVSYLPMAHRLGDMGRSGGFADWARRALYRRADRFIVPSEAVAVQIAAAGGAGPVTVAHNVVAPLASSDRVEARTALDLPLAPRIALFLGRLEAEQKGLDQLLASIKRADPARLSEWIFLFVGDGPGRTLLDAAAHDLPVNIRIVSWTDRPDLYLSAADMLLLPSRWEGVPLVMLEAMHYGLPILAADIDVYRLYLPADHVVDFDHVDLPETLDRMMRPEAITAFASDAARRLEGQSLHASQSSFVAALTPEAAR